MNIKFQTLDAFNQIQSKLNEFGFQCGKIENSDPDIEKNTEKDVATGKIVNLSKRFKTTCYLDLAKTENGVSLEVYKRENDFLLKVHMAGQHGGHIVLKNLPHISMQNSNGVIPFFTPRSTDVLYEKQNAKLQVVLEQSDTKPYQIYKDYVHDPISIVFDLKK